ncbi:MAG TPA: tetratricopeptide repeat protein [Chromatiaceae bacterium]|nr:tetratricopeptide repeat protein [Chromatiaceae bacterium]
MMNKINSPQVNDIFLKALELDREERDIFVKTACGSNQDVYASVSSLLNSAASAAEFFDQFEDDLLDKQANELEDYGARGDRLGNYELIHLIAQGGMGSVFLAKRADGQFERYVVVKMLPMGFDSSILQERLSKEQKLLAGLQHPNIAQLYDAGVTRDGRGYFVMEYVKGNTITFYCNTHKLSISRRLDLFLSLLNAVQFAHWNLVVHQDIKPSNVMVNEDGQIKLLDFGIATTISKSHANITINNGDYSQIYATPEQLAGGQITTASDTHQLGQLLFELLTDAKPKDLGLSFVSPGQNVLSTWYRSSKETTLQTWAARRCIPSTSIKKALPPDLDAIVSRAMMEDVERRYASPQDFARDILAMRQNRPVTARKPSVGYLTGKFVRRNRVSIGVISLLVMGSLFFSGFMVWQSNKTEKQRDKALRVMDLLVEIFETANPQNSPGTTPTIADALTQGAARISDKLTDQQEAQADLLAVIGRTQQSLGNYREAGNMFSRALALRQGIGPEVSVEVAKLLMYKGDNARLLGNYAEAEQTLENALASIQKLSGDHRRLRANALGKLGRVMVLQGKHRQARQHLAEAAELQLAITGDMHLDYAQALNDLASVGFAEGKYAEVEEILRRSLKIREQLGPEDANTNLDPDYATNINNLGLALFRQGKVDESEARLRQAVALRQKIYRQPHPEQAQSLTNLGLLLNSSGRSDEAMQYLKKALIIRKEAFGGRHMRVAESLNNLGMLHLSNARFAEALTLYEEALIITTELLGSEHSATAIVLNNMGQANLELGRHKTAQELYQKSLKIREQTLPARHLHLSYSQIGLGKALVANGQAEMALKYLRPGLELRESKLPSDHWLIGEGRLALAQALYAKGKSGEAQPLAQSAQKILTDRKGQDFYLTRQASRLLEIIRH